MKPSGSRLGLLSRMGPNQLSYTASSTSPIQPLSRTALTNTIRSLNTERSIRRTGCWMEALLRSCSGTSWAAKVSGPAQHAPHQPGHHTRPVMCSKQQKVQTKRTVGADAGGLTSFPAAADVCSIQALITRPGPHRRPLLRGPVASTTATQWPLLGCQTCFQQLNNSECSCSKVKKLVGADCSTVTVCCCRICRRLCGCPTPHLHHS